MKHLILAILTVFALAACDDNNNGNAAANTPGTSGGNTSSGTLFSETKSSVSDSDSIYGLWESPAIPIEDTITLTLRMKFESATVTTTSRCAYNDGVVVYAQIISAVRYENGGVNVLQAGSKEQTFDQNGKTYTCSAEVEVGFQQINIFDGTMMDDQGFSLTKIGN